MTTPKFTLGPWSITADYIERRDDTGAIGIAKALGPVNIETTANASLIASAPALYAALEDIEDIIAKTDTHGHVSIHPERKRMVLEIARAVLALARGEKGGEVK